MLPIGLGIGMQQLGHKLLGMYSRFHSYIEGKGIELYLVKTQVEYCNGEIDSQNKTRQGTAFTIRLFVK